MDPDDFDADHLGLSPEAILERLLDIRPPVEDLVVAHGDYTSDNVLLPSSGGAGGHRRAGAWPSGPLPRPRHRAPRAVRGLWSSGVGGIPLDLRTVEAIDKGRLYYYRLLDELL